MLQVFVFLVGLLTRRLLVFSLNADLQTSCRSLLDGTQTFLPSGWCGDPMTVEALPQISQPRVSPHSFVMSDDGAGHNFGPSVGPNTTGPLFGSYVAGHKFGGSFPPIGSYNNLTLIRSVLNCVRFEGSLDRGQ